MVCNRVSPLCDCPQQIGVIRYILGSYEKGCGRIMFFQNIQKFLYVRIASPVVKGQEDILFVVWNQSCFIQALDFPIAESR